MARQTTPQLLTRDFILGCLAQFTFIFVWHIHIPTLPIYLSRLGSEEAEIGVLIGSIGVSALFLRPFLGRALLKVPEKGFMIAGALLSALASFAYLFAPPFLPFPDGEGPAGGGVGLLSDGIFHLDSPSGL